MGIESTRRLIFVTHPQVMIDPSVPLTKWRLSNEGVKRMKHFSMSSAVANVTAIYSSTETKSRECAAILGEKTFLTYAEVKGLGEIDRSATGYVPPETLDKVIDEFYSRPLDSVYGRERAVDAQTRIVSAITGILHGDQSPGDIVTISHGGVGCLLITHLLGARISRAFQQQSPDGGCYFSITCDAMTLLDGWRCFEDAR